MLSMRSMSSMGSAVGADPEIVAAEAVPEKLLLLKLLLKNDVDLLTQSSCCSRRYHQSSCCCLCSCHSPSMLVNEAEVEAVSPVVPVEFIVLTPLTTIAGDGVALSPILVKKLALDVEPLLLILMSLPSRCCCCCAPWWTP